MPAPTRPPALPMARHGLVHRALAQQDLQHARTARPAPMPGRGPPVLGWQLVPPSDEVAAKDPEGHGQRPSAQAEARRLRRGAPGRRGRSGRSRCPAQPAPLPAGTPAPRGRRTGPPPGRPGARARRARLRGGTAAGHVAWPRAWLRGRGCARSLVTARCWELTRATGARRVMVFGPSQQARGLTPALTAHSGHLRPSRPADGDLDLHHDRDDHRPATGALLHESPQGCTRPPFERLEVGRRLARGGSSTAWSTTSRASSRSLSASGA